MFREKLIKNHIEVMNDYEINDRPLGVATGLGIMMAASAANYYTGLNPDQSLIIGRQYFNQGMVIGYPIFDELIDLKNTIQSFW